MKTRIYYLDNLRTFMIFLVVLLHSGLVYETVLEQSWIVSDPMKSNSIGLIRMYLDTFIMFSIFFISGYFIPTSLRNKTSKEFVLSKFKRIMVPWILAVFTLIPIYKIIFLFSRGLPQEEWYTYFHIFQKVDGNPYLFSDNPVQNWLWFLPVLFLFQVLYWVLSKTNVLSAKIAFKTGILLTLGIGLLYSLFISFSDLTGWYSSLIFHFQKERFLVYFLVFLLGSIAYKQKVLDSILEKKKQFLFVNVILAISVTAFTAFALNLFFNMVTPDRNHFFISSSMDKVIYYFSMLISMMSFIYVFIYSFKLFFNKINKIMIQLNKNSYQVYIIHVVVIGALALLMLNVNIPAFIKFLILTISAFVVSNMLVYFYKKIIRKPTSSRMAGIITLLAMMLSIGVYAKQAHQRPLYVSDTIPIAQNMGIHEAALMGNTTVIKQYIKSGAYLDEPDAIGGSSPLITAIVFGQDEVSRLLIDAGVNINFRNNEESTPLHTAAFFCRTDIVKLLLEKGADKSLRNKYGSTALESISSPFESVKDIYDYFNGEFGSLGLKLDLEEIEALRPVIVEMLR